MSELPPAVFESIPCNKENQAIWLASTFTLRRNLAQYNFPNKLQNPEIDQVIQTLREALTKTSELSHSHFFNEKELGASDRELLFEHFLFLEGFEKSQNGAGLLLDDKGEFLTLLNIGNHLEIHALNTTTNWDEIWNRLSSIEDQIGRAKGFAFNPKFGYLTANPARCGTALIVNAYLHLPALIHTDRLKSALANIEDNEVTYLGLTGNLNDLVGDILVVENNYSLGTSEEKILHAIQRVVSKLIGAEKMLRDHLKTDKTAAIKDQISKAFGLLVHAHQLETKEALDFLSLMKLGLAIDLISGTTEEKLNQLLFKCRRGHLSRIYPNITDPTEIAQKRADFLQQELQGINFKD